MQAERHGLRIAGGVTLDVPHQEETVTPLRRRLGRAAARFWRTRWL